MNKVLIVVDLQNDFITGPLGTKEAVAIVPKIDNYIDECLNQKEGFFEIIFTKDIHSKNFYKYTIEGQYIPEHCINETDGQKIVNNLNNHFGFKTIHKHTFTYTKWDEWFSVIVPDIIEIVGLCTDICVISNALVLRSVFPNARIIVHSDMCAGTTPEKHIAALEVMKSCLIEVI